jgi:hypothetical protein
MSPDGKDKNAEDRDWHWSDELHKVKITRFEDGTENKTVIEFDPANRHQYFAVLSEVVGSLSKYFGPKAAMEELKIFHTPASDLAENRNAELMARYINEGSPPVDEFAARQAAMNALLPWDSRLGTGTTIPATFAKQVRRLKKLMKKDTLFHYRVESAAAEPRTIDQECARHNRITRNKVFF